MDKTFLIALAPWLAAAALAQPVYTIQTVAGNNPLGDGGPATNAVILNMDAMTSDPSGNVYVTENQGRVRRIGVNGIITTVAGTVGLQSGGDNGPAVHAGFNVPLGIAIDSTGSLLYVSDYQNCRIRRVNLTTGIIITFAGNGTCGAGPDGSAGSTSLNYPAALFVDPQGRLVEVEAFGSRIRRIDSFGNITTIAGTGTAGLAGNGGLATQAQITSPGGLTGDSKGNLFFTDNANCLVREIDASTGILHTIAGTSCGFSGDGGAPLSAQITPGQILADPAGDIVYMTDNGTRIREINLGANQITTYAGVGTSGLSATGGPANKTQLNNAGCLAFAKDGSLLVTEAFAINRIDSSGILNAFAGKNPEAGDGGTAPNAILAYPTYVASDGKGGFVLAENFNARIRAVTSAGVITTVAGISEFTGSTGDGALAINAGISFVRGLVEDAAGNIYFTQDTLSTPLTYELRRITPAGVIDRFGTSTFLLPSGLAVDPTQHFLYLSEGTGERIDMVDLATGAATTIAGPGAPGTTGTAGFSGDNGPAANARFSNPAQLAVDAAGNLYVQDAGNARIRRISNPSSGGGIVTIAGNGNYASTGDGGFATAASLQIFGGIAADSSGNVFLSEMGRIRRVDAVAGTINTVAGGSVGGFAGDGGPALSARFANPSGLSVDSHGNVYFADLLNHRIRVLSPASTTPMITSIDTAGGFPDIAQNGWIEIKGANLAASSVSGTTWSTAPSFAMGKLPAQLGNIGVTINGIPAYIYYVSSTQINVLTPLDNTLGPVSVVVTNGGISSLPFTATLRAAAPSFLLLGTTQYDAAEHVDGSLLGPASISVPGFSFTPAQQGETIVLFAAGFALPVTTLTQGSSTQSGSLPALPTVLIGGAPATVTFAGLIAPGLYQLNAVVPTAALSGDNSLSVSYAGLTSPLGTLISVQ